MSKKTIFMKCVWVILLIAVVCLIWRGIITVFAVIKEANRTATNSFLASINSELMLLHKDFFKTDVSSEWTIVEITDYQNIAAYLASSGMVDKKHGVLCPNSVLNDCWGEQIIIGCSIVDEGNLAFILWSKGPDGKSSTPDDIVYCLMSSEPKAIQKQLIDSIVIK